MAETTCLWVVTARNILGISLRKLIGLGKEEVVNWNSLSPLPYDFHQKLPETSLIPFVHDSKIFLAGGYLQDPPPPDPASALSSEIYQLFFDKDDDDGNKKSFLRISKAAPDSIPPLPTPPAQSVIANVGGKVYLMVYDAHKMFKMVMRKEGFWVLDSGGKEWQALPGPPPFYLNGFGRCHAFSVLKGKLFFEAPNFEDGEWYLFVFDTQTSEWVQLDDNIRKSFSFLEVPRLVLFPSIMVASLSLPDNVRNRNCTRVTLSWTRKRFPFHEVRVKMYAMLLNNQDNSVLRYQSLDELSEAIQPSYFTDYGSHVKLVDLGNGLVCALVNGFSCEYNRGTIPVLCVLAFALSFAPDYKPDDPFGGKEQRFLHVDVRVNRVFTLENLRCRHFGEDLEHAFIFPSEQEEEHACSKGTTSPPRKQQKLASGTKLS